MLGAGGEVQQGLGQRGEAGAVQQDVAQCFGAGRAAGFAGSQNGVAARGKRVVEERGLSGLPGPLAALDGNERGLASRNGVWGPRPQRVQGGALALPIRR